MTASNGNLESGGLCEAHGQDFDGRNHENSRQQREQNHKITLGMMPSNRPPVNVPDDWISEQHRKLRHAEHYLDKKPEAARINAIDNLFSPPEIGAAINGPQLPALLS